MFLTPEYLAIAMEYATDGDMFQLVVRQRGLLEKDARWYFQQLIVAVDYCHRMVRSSNCAAGVTLSRLEASWHPGAFHRLISGREGESSQAFN